MPIILPILCVLRLYTGRQLQMHNDIEKNLITVTQAVINRINVLLKEKNITLYRLERNSGILHGSMSSIMSGKTKTVTLTMLILIAHGFGITIQEFLNDNMFSYENLDI